MNTDTRELITAARQTAHYVDEAMKGPHTAAAMADALNTLRQVEKSAAIIRDGAVATMRANGASWTDVGRALGISRQAAQQTYGR